jgi:hypothetical protein
LVTLHQVAVLLSTISSRPEYKTAATSRDARALLKMLLDAPLLGDLIGPLRQFPPRARKLSLAVGEYLVQGLGEDRLFLELRRAIL